MYGVCFYFAVLEYEQAYIDNLPVCECYEKSYMHRDVITHIVVTKLVSSWTEFLLFLMKKTLFLYKKIEKP